MRIVIVVLLSTKKLLQKSKRSAENAIIFPHAVKSLSAFPVTNSITVLLMSSLPLISFRPQAIYGTWFQQLSAKLPIEVLCPISTLNQQLATLEQTHIRCSLRCRMWTVKRRDCASALHSFKEINYRTDDKTKQMLQLKS